MGFFRHDGDSGSLPSPASRLVTRTRHACRRSPSRRKNPIEADTREGTKAWDAETVECELDVFLLGRYMAVRKVVRFSDAISLKD